jgi:hypothetical protein
MVYETQRKRFPTPASTVPTTSAFVASCGASREHEFSLRVEHFSNAGIKHPNPGQKFAGRECTRRFRQEPCACVRRRMFLNVGQGQICEGMLARGLLEPGLRCPGGLSV